MSFQVEIERPYTRSGARWMRDGHVIYGTLEDGVETLTLKASEQTEGGYHFQVTTQCGFLHSYPMELVVLPGGEKEDTLIKQTC